MADKRDTPSDDVRSSPESGTERDETTGNQPAAGRQEQAPGGKKDDPSHANEEA